MNQHEIILEYMKENGSITMMDGFPLGITKVNTRVSELRRRGIPITGTPETAKNKYGKTVKYMRYSLNEG